MRSDVFIHTIGKKYGGMLKEDLISDLVKLKYMIIDEQKYLHFEAEVQRKEREDTKIVILKDIPDFEIKNTIEETIFWIKGLQIPIGKKAAMILKACIRFYPDSYIPTGLIPDEVFNQFINSYYDCPCPIIDFNEDEDCKSFRLINKNRT